MSVGRSGGARGPHALISSGTSCEWVASGKSAAQCFDVAIAARSLRRNEISSATAAAPLRAVQRMAAPSSARATIAIVKNETRSAGAWATMVEPESTGAMPPKRVS